MKRSKLFTFQLGMKKGISCEVINIVPWMPGRKVVDRMIEKATISNGEQKVSVAEDYEK